jgi:hypothetical protein
MALWRHAGARSALWSERYGRVRNVPGETFGSDKLVHQLEREPAAHNDDGSDARPRPRRDGRRRRPE